MNENKIEEIAIAFYYWWHNQPGTNTEQGFKEWWALPLNFQPTQEVYIVKDIWDDGEDHHPPGYFAKEGDKVIIHESKYGSYTVAHIGNSGRFRVNPGEISKVNPS
jgi:hypothetical protein